MKKNALICGLILCLCSSLFGQTKKIRVGVLNGPSCIPAAYLMENVNNVNGAALTFEKFADPQALLPKMIKKEIDIGFMPVNVAAKVYNSSNKALICCAVTGNGNLSLITTDKKLKDIKSLKGKTIYIAGKGATPEYMFRYLLEKNGLKPDTDVVLDYSIPTAQIPANLISGKIKYAVVPEPFSTIAKSKSDKIVTAVDLQIEYEDFEGEGETYPLTVMVTTNNFVNENSDILDAFLRHYETSYIWTMENPVAAGQLTEKNDLGLAAGVVTKSIPNANYTFITGPKLKTGTEKLLKIFLKNDEKSIGGKLPDETFYYEKKNN